jgi:hypothetical protein
MHFVSVYAMTGVLTLLRALVEATVLTSKLVCAVVLQTVSLTALSVVRANSHLTLWFDLAMPFSVYFLYSF